MSLSCRPAVCWFVDVFTVCWQITNPSPSSPQTASVALTSNIFLWFSSTSSGVPPLSLWALRSSFSSRSPAIASSCGPHRARSLALTWQVPGLRRTASTNNLPTWGTKRRRWVLGGGLCLCVCWCLGEFEFCLCAQVKIKTNNIKIMKIHVQRKGKKATLVYKIEIKYVCILNTLCRLWSF